MRRAFDVEDDVLHLVPGACEGFLQLGLVVDVAAARVLDTRVEGLHDRPLDLLESVLEIHGCNGRLEQGGEHVAAERDALELRLGHVLCLVDQIAAEIELARNSGAALPRDDVGPDLGEPALRRLGKAVVEHPRDGELEHGIAEELEALVGRSTVGRPRGVGEDVIAPLGGEGIDQAQQRLPLPRAGVRVTGARRRSRRPGRRS